MKKDTKRNNLAEMLKSTPATPVAALPIQEVKPVKRQAEEDLIKLNGFWVTKTLEKRLRTHAFNAGKNLKDIHIEALELYLEKFDG